VLWVVIPGRPLQPGKPVADQEEPFSGHVAALASSF
jgi:hypothetical protein